MSEEDIKLNFITPAIQSRGEGKNKITANIARDTRTKALLEEVGYREIAVLDMQAKKVALHGKLRDGGM